MSDQRRSTAPALAIAFVALVVAVAGLGAGVYAAAKIDGSQLKPKSVAGSKLKKNTVTGKQVKESSLKGIAPSSDFVRLRSLKTVSSGVLVSPLMNMGAIHLSFQCPSGAGVWKLFARSDGAPKQYDLLVTQGGGSGDGPSETFGGLTSLTDSLILGNSNPPDTDFSRIVGSIVFNDDVRKETISVQLSINVNREGTAVTCNIAGTAVRTGS